MYTKKEEQELTKVLKKWQEKQIQIINEPYIDTALDRMVDIDRRVWELVANAVSYKDVNVIAWGMVDNILVKYEKIAKTGKI